jgi:hypothetical protein
MTRRRGRGGFLFVGRNRRMESTNDNACAEDETATRETRGEERRGKELDAQQTMRKDEQRKHDRRRGEEEGKGAQAPV